MQRGEKWIPRKIKPQVLFISFYTNQFYRNQEIEIIQQVLNIVVSDQQEIRKYIDRRA